MSMNKFISRALPAFLLALPLAALAQEQEREPIDSIVALVEEDVILQSELDQAIETVERQVQASGQNMPPRSVLEEQVLERLIMTRLQVLRAEQTGIRVSDSDVDQALNRVASQNNMTVAQMRNALEADGLDYQAFRQEIRNEMLMSRLRQRVVNSMDPITDTEIDIALASDRFSGREYQLSQIIIRVSEAATPAAVRQAQERIEEIYRRLDEGMSFSSAAITYSEGQDALDGGRIGWRNLSALPRSFSEELQDLEPGEVSDPLRTQGGFVILKVEDVRERSDVIVEEYKARHILVSPSELVSPEEARERIESLHQRILEGEDFAELAREYSSDESTANIGGLLDWFPAQAYGPPISRVVTTLEPGELSEPFQGPDGWHLLKLVDVRERDRTEEAIRAQAREALFDQKAQEEVDRFMRQLRAEAFVEIRL